MTDAMHGQAGRERRTSPATNPVIHSARKETQTSSHFTKRLGWLAQTNSTRKLFAHLRTKQQSTISYRQSETNSAVLIIQLTAQLIHKYSTAEADSVSLLWSLNMQKKKSIVVKMRLLRESGQGANKRSTLAQHVWKANGLIIDNEEYSITNQSPWENWPSKMALSHQEYSLSGLTKL